MSIKILYGREGIDFQGDPYSYAGDESLRYLLKDILLIFLNAKKGKQSAMAAIRKKIREDRDPEKKEPGEPRKYPDWVDPKKDLPRIADEFLKQHPRIEKYFYSGLGIELQRTDSDMAEKIMMDLMTEDIVVLPVHDSFICKVEDKPKLLEKMEEAYSMFVHGYRPVMKAKPSLVDPRKPRIIYDKSGNASQIVTTDGKLIKRDHPDFDHYLLLYKSY